MWSALATVYEHLKRLPEAIQSNNRALLGADAPQTVNILAKLAQLYDNAGVYAKAANTHRLLILIGEREGHSVIDVAQSYLYVAQYDLDQLYRDRTWWSSAGKDAGGGKKGAGDGAVGRRKTDNVDAAPQMAEERQQAIAYLTEVATSNAPEESAEEDLRYLKKRDEKDV